MSAPPVLARIEGCAGRLTLNRPQALHALNTEMCLLMTQALLAWREDPAVALVVIDHAGERGFCAGGDIEAWSALHPADFALAWVRVGHRAFDALARLRQPLIAALNGHALGGGLELAATADFRIAEDHVKIGSPETGLGIIPGWSGTQRTVNRFGPQLVRRMALLGEVFTAEQSLGLGLVDALAPQGGGLAAATAMARRLMARGPLATQATKMLINAAEGEELHRPLEALAGGLAAGSEDLRKGVDAFRQKRTPDF